MNKKDKEDFKEQGKLQSLKAKSEESRESVTGFMETGNPKELAQSNRAKAGRAK
ncbi:MAG TPA: hypothetical protein VIK72_03130 [Clostridiaceae bacterium]